MYVQVKFIDNTYKKKFDLNRVIFSGDQIVINFTYLTKVVSS